MCALRETDRFCLGDGDGDSEGDEVRTTFSVLPKSNVNAAAAAFVGRADEDDDGKDDEEGTTTGKWYRFRPVVRATGTAIPV